MTNTKGKMKTKTRLVETQSTQKFIVQMDYTDKDRMVFVGPTGYLTAMGGQMVAHEAVKNLKWLKAKAICRDYPYQNSMALLVGYTYPKYMRRDTVYKKIVAELSKYTV